MKFVKYSLRNEKGYIYPFQVTTLHQCLFSLEIHVVQLKLTGLHLYVGLNKCNR